MGVGGNLKCKAERREKGKRDPENPGAGTQNSAPRTQNLLSSGFVAGGLQKLAALSALCEDQTTGRKKQKR